MLDLSSIVPPKDENPFYDMDLHHLREMHEHQRNAHISSMLYSQRKDYGKKLRIVIDAEAFGLAPAEIDQTLAKLDKLPGIKAAMTHAIEVVVRNIPNFGAQEYAMKAEGSLPGFRPATGGTVQSQARTEEVKLNSSGRLAIDWGDDA